MPCYDSRDHEDSTAAVRQAQREFRHNSDVAEMLCEVMTFMQAQGLANDSFCSAATLNWWEEHKARDIRRAGGA